ncbi:MAG TPA: Coenzyme F420 hydrogenase/dehydrogenase, beta subunit C-terminal domain [Methanoregulaceae archaeon]|nr:Coenzyme F420 hydrogenase/dehydrogenase, beta subunit C-terminal domain [Methanoregulaceae archaeon]
MTSKGDMLYAWTNDEEIKKKAELGGAVTALWKHALDSKTVDAVLAISKGKDLYDAKPVLLTSSEELKNTAGSLHCGTLLIPKLIKYYLDGANTMKIGVTVKGCDAMAFYELAKRQQINLDNVVMIGVNCGGSVSPVLARHMITDKFGVDPDTVHKEEIDKGQFIIEYEGGHKGISIDELEEAGYGRRSNCRRCKMKIPRQADLACGNWGVIGEKAGKATFVEVCSEKGAKLLDGAVKSGVLSTEKANPKGLEIRGKVEGAMFKLGDKWRKHDFESLGDGKARLEKIVSETSRCIKCYSCITACPICYCVECSTKKASLVPPGEIPPNFMFHLIRFAHIADSCVNCGQCQELCPAEIPNTLFMHAQQVELEKMFGHTPGISMELPVLALADEKEERARLSSTGSDQIFNIFK